MPLNINANTNALDAQRYLNINTIKLQKSMQMLASGYRINQAGDDAAGLALSESLRSQIRGTNKASDNVQDGINLLNVADGALQTITDSLQRMRELAVQAGNDTYSTAQRSAMSAEFAQLASGINQIATSTQFNGVKLLSGSASTLKLQVGANTTSGVDTLNIGGQGVFNSINASALSITSTVKLDTSAHALSAIGTLDTAIQTVNTRRGKIGGLSNRLESTSNNLAITSENLSASESQIRNVDVASESAHLAQYQILQQVSAAMLSQANQAPQLALSLLKGG